MNGKTILVGLVFFLLCSVAVYFYGRHRGYESGYADGVGDIQHDTTVVVDTVREYYPVETYKYVDRPVYVAVTDTMIVHRNDTTYVVLDKEVKGYQDDDFALEIEGVQPALRWIEVYPKTITITNTIVDNRRWTFGITAGPAVVYDGKFHGGIGVAAGLQYRFGR